MSAKTQSVFASQSYLIRSALLQLEQYWRTANGLLRTVFALSQRCMRGTANQGTPPAKASRRSAEGHILQWQAKQPQMLDPTGRLAVAAPHGHENSIASGILPARVTINHAHETSIKNFFFHIHTQSVESVARARSLLR